MYFDHHDHHEHHDFHGHHHGHGHGHHGHHGEFGHQHEGGAEQQGETNSASSVICPCMGVAESDIQRAVANGARTLEDVEDATGADTRCGRCVGAIEACLQRELAALAS